jgi:hypothetical protein
VLTDKVLDPIKNDVILAAIASGDLDMPPAKDGETPAQALRRATKGEWRWPARMTIDVGRESAANLNEHRQGIKSGQQIAAEQGTDFETVLEQKAIEAALVREFSTKYGVPETAIQLITTSLPSTPAAAAASGENVGAAASAAQSASTPGAEAISAELSSLNGAQVTAALSVLENLRGGSIADAEAVSLLKSFGMADDSARRVVDAVAGLPIEPAATTEAAMRAHVDVARGLTTRNTATVRKLEKEVGEVAIFNDLLSGFTDAKK